jgi:tetratricopeptide (TPR) repeat protein
MNTESRNNLFHARQALSMKQFADAVQICQDTLMNDPRNVEAIYLIGMACHQQGNSKEAIRLLKAGITIDPQNHELQYALGTVLCSEGRYEESLLPYRTAVRLNPRNTEAQYNLAKALHDCGQIRQSSEMYSLFVKNCPHDPDGWYNMGNNHEALDEPELAERCYLKTLEIDPNHNNAPNNLAIVIKNQGRVNCAIDIHRDLLGRQPSRADAHWNYGLALLLKGDFEQGWPEYEWRWLMEENRNVPDYPCPWWRGEELKGKSILLWMEQGRGDAIQFARFADWLNAGGATVFVQCVDEMCQILACTLGIKAVFRFDERAPHCDFHCPMMSTPSIIGFDPEKYSPVIPYVCVEPALVMKFKRYIVHSPDLLKIGLVWGGNPQHLDDRHRSFHLSEAHSLFDLPGVTFYSLQKGEYALDLDKNNFPVIDLNPHIKDFLDTAAIMKSLDLVISVDTASLHLAGAIGVPVWGLIPFAPDWRWMLARTDSPWYPTMKLFRQKNRNDWQGVFSAVKRELQKLKS